LAQKLTTGLFLTVKLQWGLHRGLTTGGQGGHNSPGAGSLWGRQMSAGSPKSLNNFTGTFFNTVPFLPKDLRFELGGAKLVSFPGRRLTSLRPWAYKIIITFAVRRNFALC